MTSPRSYFFLLWIGIANSQDNGEFFVDCSIDEYYTDVRRNEFLSNSWDPVALANLLRDTHRQVLPYTSSSREDVWDALIDLDSDQGTIDLIYSANNMAALNYGTPDTWNREHLWPQSRGVGSSGPDYTDVHHLRPSDWNINAARGNLFFGDCEDTCTNRPADEEAAFDTGSNSDMFLPPANVRGDIARALFYMALRYSFLDEQNTEVLELTDCPNDDIGHQMAYLSELLRWHEEDPPDDIERQRNQRVCSRWQGNRNVFIDFPELATYLHGVAADKPYRCNSQQSGFPTLLPTTDATSTTTTDTPTASGMGTIAPTITSSSTYLCDQLSPGDVQVISLSADNPDAIVLLALEDLPLGLELYMTDNAWTGSEFRVNEGTVRLSLTDRIPIGTVFGYGVETSMRILWGDSWESVGSGGFALATAGDSVLLYCLFDDGRINHLGGLMSGTWAADDSAVDGTNQSQKPNSLDEVGAIEIIGGWDNLLYTGTRRGSKDALLMALADSSNWKGSNSEQFIFSEGNFEILGESSTKQGITNHEELASDSSSGLLTIWVGNLSTTLLAFILSLT